MKWVSTLQGAIAIGNYADIVVWNPDVDFDLDDSHHVYIKHPVCMPCLYFWFHHLTFSDQQSCHTLGRKSLSWAFTAFVVWWSKIIPQTLFPVYRVFQPTWEQSYLEKSQLLLLEETLSSKKEIMLLQPVVFRFWPNNNSNLITK